MKCPTERADRMTTVDQTAVRCTVALRNPRRKRRGAGFGARLAAAGSALCDLQQQLQHLGFPAFSDLHEVVASGLPRGVRFALLLERQRE